MMGARWLRWYRVRMYSKFLDPSPERAIARITTSSPYDALVGR